MAILDNQLVSFQDLQDLIDGGGFQENNPFSPSNLLADKLECLDALVLDPAPLVPLADNQLVQYDLLVSGGDVTNPAQMLITSIESIDNVSPAQMLITNIESIDTESPAQMLITSIESIDTESPAQMLITNIENIDTESPAQMLITSIENIDNVSPAQMLITNIISSDDISPAQMLITKIESIATLTQFNYNSTLGLISEVCGLTAATIAYHNGSNALPDVGDNCYVDINGNTPLGSTGSLYNKSGANEYIKIGSNGLITEQGTCGTGLKDFQLAVIGYSLHTESCSGTNVTETKWHDGNLTYPEGQDTIFNTNNLGDIFNGGGLWYKEPAILVTIKIGTDGVMDDTIGNC